MRQAIAEFTTLVNGARCLRRAVTPDSARERELTEEMAEPLFVFGTFRVDFGIGSFQVRVRKNCRGSMSGAGKEDHVQIVFLDQPVEMQIDEAQAGVRPPVPEQPNLCVLRRKWSSQKRIVPQVNHPEAEVQACAEVGIDLAQLIGGER